MMKDRIQARINMKISIYVGTRGGMFGGAENTIHALAEALAPSNEVELVSHDPGMTAAKFFRDNTPPGVSMRHIPDEPIPAGRIYPGRRAALMHWNESASRGADFFLNISNRSAPVCHARMGITRVFFPFQIPPHLSGGKGLRARARSFYLRREWEAKWRTYDCVVANSNYTAQWVKRRWGVDCRVIHPPVDTGFQPREKAPLIVSVGRFALWGNAKKQLELMRAFRVARELRGAGWRYCSIGGLGRGEGDPEFLESVRAEAPQEADLMVDAPRLEMKSVLERASIFWHAAGWGEDPMESPETYEHFGQSTVEAMAAGCVPVVIDGGGQPEIVEHGTSGFLWKTREELLHYTRELAEDSALRASMSEAAVRRAALFGKPVFVRQFRDLIRDIANARGIS